MTELVIAGVALLVAVAAIVLVMRVRPGGEQSVQAMQAELNVMRATTQTAMSGMSSMFSAQLQSLGQNMQTALAAVGEQVANRLEAVQQNVAQRLNENAQAMASTSNAVNQRIANVQTTFAELQKQVGEMSEQARQLAEVSRSMAALERVLSAPKLRGGFGEAQLENLLSQVFAADQYDVQYRFPSGDVADAVLHFPQGKVAIDSKFSLENFRRISEAESEEEKKGARRDFLKDVRKRIDEIAGKYIRPADGTLPIALMYVPAENVYYEAIIRDDDGNDLYEYCMARRVLPVSPNSLYAYLQTILVGLNGLRISERAESILRELGSLRQEMERFSEAYGKVGTHLRNAAERYTESVPLLNKVETRVEGLATRGGGQGELFQGEKRSLAAGKD